MENVQYFLSLSQLTTIRGKSQRYESPIPQCRPRLRWKLFFLVSIRVEMMMACEESDYLLLTSQSLSYFIFKSDDSAHPHTLILGTEKANVDNLFLKKVTAIYIFKSSIDTARKEGRRGERNSLPTTGRYLGTSQDCRSGHSSAPATVCCLRSCGSLRRH